MKHCQHEPQDLKISMKELPFLISRFEVGDGIKAVWIEQLGSQSC